MGVGADKLWSGEEFLYQVAGPSCDASPVRALYLAHRVAASGRLWMSRGVEVCSITISEGTIGGCSGFQHLIDGKEGERQWSLAAWAEAVEDGDVGALNRVAQSLCRAAIKVESDGDWMVNFISTDEPPPKDATIPETLSASLQAAIGTAITDADVRAWLAEATQTKVEVWRPDDCLPEKWGLSPEAHRLLDACESNGSVGSLYVEIGVGGWPSFGILWRLGLVFVPSIDGLETAGENAFPEPFIEPEPTEEETAEVEPPAPAHQPDHPKPAPKKERASSERPTRARPPKTTEKTSQKRDVASPARKRKIDPRRAILNRSPSQSAPDQMETHLKEAHEILSTVSPEFIFRVRKVEDLDMRMVEQRYHKAASRYHPDRFRGATQGVKSLAEGCFTAVADSFHKLKEEGYLENLKNRLIEKETGKKVVTDKTRAKATVDHAKADVLFKQKRYEDAHRYAKRAVESDPDKWQYQFLQLRCAYRAGMMSLTEVEPELLRLQGMRTEEKAEHLSILGEMFLREGDETRAYKLFHQSLSLDSQNVGASRRVRLRSRREKEDDNKSGGGLFGGLFKGRKG
jgi:hypothetical protein